MRSSPDSQALDALGLRAEPYADGEIFMAGAHDQVAHATAGRDRQRFLAGTAVLHLDPASDGQGGFDGFVLDECCERRVLKSRERAELYLM